MGAVALSPNLIRAVMAHVPTSVCEGAAIAQLNGGLASEQDAGDSRFTVGRGLGRAAEPPVFIRGQVRRTFIDESPQEV